MNVEIHDRRAGDAGLTLEHANGDGHVVERAESLAVIGERVMRAAGEIHGDAIIARGAGSGDGSTN
jgi:hypothetical protein